VLAGLTPPEASFSHLQPFWMPRPPIQPSLLALAPWRHGPGGAGLLDQRPVVLQPL